MQKYDIAGYDAIKIKIFKYRPKTAPSLPAPNRQSFHTVQPSLTNLGSAEPKSAPFESRRKRSPSKSPPAAQFEPREYRQSSARKNRRLTPSAIKIGTAAAPPLPTVRISDRTTDAENRLGSILPLHYRR